VLALVLPQLGQLRVPAGVVPGSFAALLGPPYNLYGGFPFSAVSTKNG
jgi:hypothetical protein